jgi:hemolysin III
MAALVLNPTFDWTAPGVQIPRSHPIYGARPTLRGRFHQLGSFISLPLGLYLVLGIARPDARIEVLIYALSSSLMFITSASYHQLAQSVIARFWMRRLDHSMIFIHIAGATTPIALLGAGGTQGKILLATSWTGALIGTGLKMTRLTADHDPCAWFFPLLGFLPLLTIPQLATTIGVGSAVLLAGSGLIYVAGATVFARKSPDPVPRVFGYHEVWHVFTLAAGACQFLVTVQLAG